MSIKASTFTATGNQATATELPAEIFGVKVRPELISQAVRVYLSNQRQGTKHAQTRSEVTRTGAKVWRQKGTGRARHGSRRAPIFVGGGKAHGPKGNENYQLTLSQKMRQAAVRMSFTTKATDQAISIITGLDKVESKTKTLNNLMQKVVPNFSTKKVLLLLEDSKPELIQAAANLQTLTIGQAYRTSTYEILNHHTILITDKAIEILVKTFAATKQPAASPKPKSATNSKNKPTKENTKAKPASDKKTTKTTKTTKATKATK